MTTERANPVSPTHRYGAGLPKTGTRALEDDEPARVERACQRAAVWLVAASTGVVLSLAVALLLPHVDPPDPRITFGTSLAALASLAALVLGGLGVRVGILLGLLALGVVSFMAAEMPEARPAHPILVTALELGTVAVAFGFVVARLLDALALLRRRAELADDLREGVVERCAGRLRDLRDARTFRILQRRGDVLDAGLQHEIELLPRSCFVLRVDGRPPSRPLLATVTSIAPAAPHALRIALPPDLSAIASPTVALQRRGLTPAEREELLRHATTLRRPPWHLFLSTPACLAAAWWQWQHALRDQPWVGLMAVAVSLAAGASGLHFVQRRRTASRLRADESLRWLVTVTERDAAAGSVPQLEMLAVSRLAWTEHARPAPWRLG